MLSLHYLVAGAEGMDTVYGFCRKLFNLGESPLIQVSASIKKKKKQAGRGRGTRKYTQKTE